jgi:hypothetical protein
MMSVILSVTVAAAGYDTSALDDMQFYDADPIRAEDSWGVVTATMKSLNAGLWSAANATKVEGPFNAINSGHGARMETVLNFTASPACADTYTNLSTTGGVATLPDCTGTCTAASGVSLGTTHGLSYAQCVSSCCTSQNCKAFAWYDTTDQGLLCATFTEGFTEGPQPFGPSNKCRHAQGGVLTVPASPVDQIVNGLRSGTFLGGVGTGGYELRADGTFHLSTLRNQHPAAEPWQGTVRDATLAVAVNGSPHVVRLRPFGGLSGVPRIVYQDRFPAAKLSFPVQSFNLTLFAYSALRPGDTNGSNTPAVVFTLHATNSQPAGGAPLDVSFMVLQGLGLRNDFTQAGPKGAAVPGQFANASACAAACVGAGAGAGAGEPCLAWQWDAAARSCTADGAAAGFSQGANRPGVDSGTPGAFSFSAAPADPSVVFSTIGAGGKKAFNGLGSQGLFVPEIATPSGGKVSRGAAAAASAEELLGALKATDPAAALAAKPRSAGADALFAAAAATANGVAPGESVSLSVAHAWFFPVRCVNTRACEYY